MPIYEYRCPKCGKDFELMRPFSKADEAAPCPDCGSPGEKLISVFSSTVDFGIKGPSQPAFREPAKKRKKRSKPSK